MNLLVQRDRATPNSTPGQLSIPNLFHCFTLEPAHPIPAGTYKVAMLRSPHFGCIVPHVLDVPGHTGIEIHWGDYPHDTHDCLLVGLTWAADFVGNSKDAFAQLMSVLPLDSANEEITITYVDYMLVTDPELGL